MQLASGPYFLPKGGLQVQLAQRSSLCRSSELTKSISSGVILPEHSNSRQPLSKPTLQPSGVILPEQSNSHLLLNELRLRSKFSMSSLGLLLSRYGTDDGLDDTHGDPAFCSS